MNTLLEQAKNIKINRKHKSYSKEELELAKAWLNGDIHLEQVRKVMNLNSGTAIYTFLAFASRELFQNNNIK